MNDFFTWDYLLSFAGCVIATGLLTQGVKALLPKLHAQWISYVIALCILTVAQLATRTMTGWETIALNLVNAMVISLSANGGYDALTNLFPPSDGEVDKPDISDK